MCDTFVQQNNIISYTLLNTKSYYVIGMSKSVILY